MAEALNSAHNERQTAPDSAQKRAKTDERPVIRAKCESYACRACRTKTGWPHQSWCELSRLTEPDCADCRYWNVKKARCGHPVLRRGGDQG